mmetsp:Transcript_4951/g.9286  ORF Transcript_4951/g.9286 Transcript_4951/m.9286 type:complete len:322 (+) Transcript_4951:216-1181(+)
MKAAMGSHTGLPRTRLTTAATRVSSCTAGGGSATSTALVRAHTNSNRRRSLAMARRGSTRWSPAPSAVSLRVTSLPSGTCTRRVCMTVTNLRRAAAELSASCTDCSLWHLSSTTDNAAWNTSCATALAKSGWERRSATATRVTFSGPRLLTVSTAKLSSSSSRTTSSTAGTLSASHTSASTQECTSLRALGLHWARRRVPAAPRARTHSPLITSAPPLSGTGTRPWEMAASTAREEEEEEGVLQLRLAQTCFSTRTTARLSLGFMQAPGARRCVATRQLSKASGEGDSRMPSSLSSSEYCAYAAGSWKAKGARSFVSGRRR